MPGSLLLVTVVFFIFALGKLATLCVWAFLLGIIGTLLISSLTGQTLGSPLFLAGCSVCCMYIAEHNLFPKYCRLENAPAPDNKYPGYILNRNFFWHASLVFITVMKCLRLCSLRRREIIYLTVLEHQGHGTGITSALSRALCGRISVSQRWQLEAGSQRLRSGPGFYDACCHESELKKPGCCFLFFFLP